MKPLKTCRKLLSDIKKTILLRRVLKMRQFSIRMERKLNLYEITLGSRTSEYSSVWISLDEKNILPYHALFTLMLYWLLQYSNSSDVCVVEIFTCKYCVTLDAYYSFYIFLLLKVLDSFFLNLIVLVFQLNHSFDDSLQERNTLLSKDIPKLK